jgi:excisionase family DNA binding protein
MTERADKSHVTRLPLPTRVEGSDEARLMTIEQAAGILNVPENWLRKKVSAHEVPHTRLGKHVRFTDEHLDQIIESGEQCAVASVSPSGVSRRARRSAS